jgi:hypothetical protein
MRSVADLLKLEDRRVLAALRPLSRCLQELIG